MIKYKPSILQLGQLVRGFREARGLTQDELATASSSNTNRSQVAHLEQGLRIPPSGILRSICSYLDIPESIWMPFESSELRSRLNQGMSESYSSAPRIIGVSGGMGSGKTTLAQQIARSLGYYYVAESPHAKKYLHDLFENPSRWAFETQLAFLLNKAVDINRALAKYPGLVIDRTLSEDVSIFAKYFHSEGYIDDRAYESYKSLADYFESQIPDPDLVIYCKCDVSVASERIIERARGDLSNHSHGFLSDIYGRYDKWLGGTHNTSIYIADSSIWDWRTNDVVTKIVRDISLLYARSYFQSQFELFDDNKWPKEGALQILQPYFLAVRAIENSGLFQLPATGTSLLPYPAAYIAAPFTAFAGSPQNDSTELFKKPHGEIKRGKLRNALLGIERALREYGIASLIPHRDVNQWGKLTLEPQQVAKLCSEQVSRTDLFVGILGMSHGAHYEFGLARGLGKPCVVIHCRELEDSFLGGGIVTNGTQMLALECERLNQIPDVLASNEVSEFIRRHF